MKALLFSIALTVLGSSVIAEQAPTQDWARHQPVAAETIVTEGEVLDGVQLKVPNTCEVGELVRLDASASNVDSLAWSILPDTPDFETVSEGKRAFFSARSGGEYLIIVAGAKDGKAYLIHKTITVKGIPRPLSGLSAKISGWLSLLPDIEDRNMKLLSMATVFKKLAQEPVAPDKMVEATALANSAVLGDTIEKWIPFLDKLGTELDKLIEDGKLSTTEQFQATWNEIASSLERHARK